MGCILWKQAVEAKREPADKYGDFRVHPQQGSGPIRVGGTQGTGYVGCLIGKPRLLPRFAVVCFPARRCSRSGGWPLSEITPSIAF